ncbi:hypothetical protein GEMRC1_006021 [Eukaryota sp. GEM-RC1]
MGFSSDSETDTDQIQSSILNSAANFEKKRSLEVERAVSTGPKVPVFIPQIEEEDEEEVANDHDLPATELESRNTAKNDSELQDHNASLQETQQSSTPISTSTDNSTDNSIPGIDDVIQDAGLKRRSQKIDSFDCNTLEHQAPELKKSNVNEAEVVETHQEQDKPSVVVDIPKVEPKQKTTTEKPKVEAKDASSSSEYDSEYDTESESSDSPSSDEETDPVAALIADSKRLQAESQKHAPKVKTSTVNHTSPAMTRSHLRKKSGKKTNDRINEFTPEMVRQLADATKKS